VPAATTTSTEPPLTPSQLKKLARTWIEIELVDQDDEPYTGPYRIELPDSSTTEGDFDEEGSYGNYDLDPGTCKLSLTAIRVPGGAVEQAPAAAAEDEPAETAEESKQAEPEQEVLEGAAVEEAPPEFEPEKSPVQLRFKLLDLVGKPIAGASVTVAGKLLNTDGEGLVEAEVTEGASGVTTTLPSGDVELRLGGLDPQDDGDSSWKLRLFNLGYLWDTNVKADDGEMIFALEDFQAQYSLEVTGHLDDTTKAKLRDAYGC
jgi:hypothetical protein